MRKLLAFLPIILFLAFAPGIHAQTSAPDHPAVSGKALPTIQLSTGHAKAEAQPIAKTGDGTTIYRGGRGGMYYMAKRADGTEYKRYLSKEQKEKVEQMLKQ